VATARAAAASTEAQQPVAMADFLKNNQPAVICNDSSNSSGTGNIMEQ